MKKVDGVGYAPHSADLFLREFPKLLFAKNLRFFRKFNATLHYRLDKQLRRILLASEPQWTEKGIEVSAELEEMSVEADEELMSQVWINLLHNAMKFTLSGGEIAVRLERAGERAAVSFTDTGIGIRDEDMPHIFERFYKADKSRNRSAGGSGLGLALVKKIVDMHEGEIQATSTPGEGSTFRVLIPASHPKSES